MAKTLKNAVGQRARIVFCDQKSGSLIADDFWNGAATSSDYWTPGSHGFDRGNPEPFVPDRRERENIGVIIKINQLWSRDKAAKGNLFTRRRRQSLPQMGEISSGIGRR